MSNEWITRIKVLAISAFFASIANAINTAKSGAMVSPLAAAPGLLLMFAMVIISCLIQQVLEKALKFHLPTIIYITMVSVIASIPGVSPIANLVITEFGKIGLLPLCTPILAYAGVSMGKDWPEFKRQGLAIVCVALCTFAGTYLGSAIIAQLVLKMTGVI